MCAKIILRGALSDMCICEMLTFEFFRGPANFFGSMDVTNFHPIGRSKVDENFQDTSVW